MSCDTKQSPPDKSDPAACVYCLPGDPNINGIRTIAQMDTIPKGTIPNEHHPEWHNPEWTPSRMDTIPNEHLPSY